MDNEIRPRKAMGGSGIQKVSGQGSSASSFLFYFLPNTNGRAYVVIIRHEDYKNLAYCTIRVTNTEEGYDETQSSEDVSAYLHRMEFEGLETGVTYTIRMSWYTSSGIEVYAAQIQRTYYCNNETPSDAPYVDTDGITVYNYQNTFPKYCVNVKCAGYSTPEDGRCPYDYTTRNLFWSVCATNYETHPIASAMEAQPTVRWPSGTVYVKVSYMGNSNEEYESNCQQIEARIGEWIDWMNGITEDYGVHFQRGSTTAKNGKMISVYIGTHQQLWGTDPDDIEPGGETYIYGGTWESVSWRDGIIESRVKICCESRYPWNYVSKISPPLFEGIVFEELTEACGPRYDQFGINNTIFSEFSYPTKSLGGPEGEPRERDENVVRILYSLGYLKGETASKTEGSEFGTVIKFDKIYDSYGPLSSSSPDLFFQINATQGSVVRHSYESVTDLIGIYFKSNRAYWLSATYATEVPDTRKEEEKNLSFRYSNPSAETAFYNSLPKKPVYTSSKKINQGYEFGVSGLTTLDEYYVVDAWLKDLTDNDIDNNIARVMAMKKDLPTSIRIEDLQYGRTYDFYLYGSYDGVHSDWTHIGEGVIPPMVPIVDDLRNTDTTVSFSYDMNGTTFDKVVYELYRNDEKIKSGSYTGDENSIEISFEKVVGRYDLKIYSVVTSNGVNIQCVDDDGDLDFVTYSFTISERVKFYWSDAVESGKPVSDVSYTEWKNFVTNVRDTICIYKGINGTMPDNSSIYASGFGLAAGKSFETALMNYAIITENSNMNLSAERFNIVNYIIRCCKETNVSYKYKKSVQQCEVIADELIQLQNILNSL